MDIAILGFESCLGLGFIGAADMLTLSRRMLAKKDAPEPYRVVTVSHDGQPVRDGAGRRFEVDARFDEVDGCAAIIVPGYLCDGGHALPPTPAIGAAAAWLRRQHALGAIVAGSCNGAFLLGEAGLLDGRRCTTTWWRHNELKARYPRADAAWGATLIEDGRVVTAGGPLSWIDLSLHIIRALLGPEAAKKAADFTVVDTVPSTQAIYIPPGHLSASNPFLLEAEHIVRQAGRRAAHDDRTRALARCFRAHPASSAERGVGRNPEAFSRPGSVRDGAHAAGDDAQFGQAARRRLGLCG